MGKGIRFLAKTTQNENIIKIKFIFYYIIDVYAFDLLDFCSFRFIVLNFIIGIPEDNLNQEFLQTRALSKFSTEFLGC